MKYGGFLFYMNNNRKGLWISYEIITDEKLDWLNKILLSEIYSYSKLELGCIASNETFAKLLGIHKGNVSKRIAWLVEEKYIKLLLFKKGEKRTTRVIIPHKAVSDNAQSSKRIRTEEYADTQQGVSGYAPSSKRQRSPKRTETKTIIETGTNSVISTDNKTADEWINNYLNK